MDVEEIVALSVKHNVSDLHLCSDSPPRWRRFTASSATSQPTCATSPS